MNIESHENVEELEKMQNNEPLKNISFMVIIFKWPLNFIIAPSLQLLQRHALNFSLSVVP